MGKKDDSTLVYRVAKYYFQDNLSQNEIAQLEGISRSTISRLLEKAKENNIVTIDIKIPQNPEVEKIAAQLRNALDLRNVIVVPVSVSKNNDDTEEIILRDLVCIAAAKMPDLLKGSQFVGLGWGRTIYNVGTYLPLIKPDKDMFFIPLVSNFTTHNRFLQTSVIVSRYAEKFSANEYFLNISSAKRNDESRTKQETSSILQLHKYWDLLDAAIISVGAPQRVTERYLFDEVPPESFLKARNDSSAVFESLGQIYFESGSHQCLSVDFEILALELERLKTIPNVICISGGILKAIPIIHAARNKFIKTLIVDHLTATKILQMI